MLEVKNQATDKKIIYWIYKKSFQSHIRDLYNYIVDLAMHGKYIFLRKLNIILEQKEKEMGWDRAAGGGLL